METKDWYKLTFLIDSDSEEIVIWKLNELGIFSFSFEYLIKNANKKEVSNKELWTELDQLNSKFEINWNWVKAHSTDKLNNEVDLLAKDAANLQ